MNRSCHHLLQCTRVCRHTPLLLVGAIPCPLDTQSVAWLALKVCAPLFAFAAVVGGVGALTVHVDPCQAGGDGQLVHAKALFLRD